MNLSFAGCGFLGIYHVGVACCFKKYAPHLLLNKISGASFGAIAACCLLCDLPLGEMTSNVLKIARDARTPVLGPFSPSFNVQNALIESLETYLPEDAHLRVSGKLYISLTRVYDGKNVLVYEFKTRDELLQALLASAFVPVFSGIIPPKFRGVRYMDGGFSDNLPTLDENTITVSPFCGESDICPRDDSSQLFHINLANTSIELSKQNIYRFARILFPPKPEVLSDMCRRGFDDALRFLHRNNLINCTRCLAVQSTFVLTDALTDNDAEYDPECKQCQEHRQEALVSNMPETVVTVLQEAIESANKGLINWIFRRRGMRLLSLLTLPYTLPADIVCATYTKLMHSSPFLRHNLFGVSKFLADQVMAFVSRKQYQYDSHTSSSSRISCHLAINEYGRDNISVDGNSTVAISRQNNVNLDFSLNMDKDDMEINEKTFGAKTMLSRQASKTHIHEDDTFDHILQVTSHQDAIMAYYYLDDDNKVKVTEIFDLTDTECEALHTQHERDNNKQLQFDDEWDTPSWCTSDQNNHTALAINDDDQSLDGISELSLEEILDRSEQIFSDPESEWNDTVTNNQRGVHISQVNQNETSQQKRPTTVRSQSSITLNTRSNSHTCLHALMRKSPLHRSHHQLNCFDLRPESEQTQ